MSYKAYGKYKESKIKWIGEIPSTWDTIKAKHCFNLSGGYAFKSDDFIEEGIPLVRIGDITNGTIDFNKCKRLPSEYATIMKEFLVKPGDILIALTGATIGKIGQVPQSNEKILLNQRVGKLSSDASNYYKYILSSDLIKEQIMLIADGSAQENISNEDIGNFEIFDIDDNTKQQITTYLDKKTANIDATIAKNEELIQLLEEKRVALINQVVTKGLNPEVSMKDSGVEWIGEIPEHWAVEKIKNISQVKPSNVDTKSKDNEPPVLLCNYTDVYNNEFITMELDFMKATATHDQIRKLSLDVEDIIITKDSESADDIAVPAIVTEELENVVCGYHLAVIKPNTSIINPKFLFRSFESDRINKQFELGANGVTRFGLGTYPISNAYVCQPPLNEQKEIANYLDIETAKIFKATDKILNHIELLEEYKTSLIHHVVTGKIDVRGEEI